ncbi:XkdX family protein [Lactobacillus sp. XV13L]|nr:XkdX family protein [Lactobacillus sp. XV13L]
MNNHSLMFQSLKTAFQDWKMMTEEMVKTFVPYSITQAECDEILGVEQVKTPEQPATTAPAQPTTNPTEAQSSPATN